jgi:hypothetical protein
MSNLKPSASNWRALPPGVAFFSRTVTEQPSLARQQAADNPANPDPMTTTLGDKWLILLDRYKTAKTGIGLKWSREI